MKKPFYKRWWFLAIIAFVVIDVAAAFGALISSTRSRTRSEDSFPQETPSLTVSGICNAITSINGVSNIEIVTEENDPNGSLGVPGSYVGAIYFKHVLAKPDARKSSIDEGCIGGGCVEMYASQTDAENRNKYLAKFDGTLIDSGYHTVYDTLVIRTSSRMSESQQKALELEILTSILDANKPEIQDMASSDAILGTTNEAQSETTELTFSLPAMQVMTTATTTATTEKLSIAPTTTITMTARTTLTWHSTTTTTTTEKPINSPQSDRITVDSIQAGRDLNNDYGRYITRAALSGAGRRVYVSASGAGLKYHYDETCSNMLGTIATTIDEAQEAGFTLCGKED